MSGRFHIEGLRQVERQLDAFTLQLIHNAAVVNAEYRKFTPILLVEQQITALLQAEDIDDRNPQVALRGQKIAEMSCFSGWISSKITFSGSWPATITFRKSRI